MMAKHSLGEFVATVRGWKGMVTRDLDAAYRGIVATTAVGGVVTPGRYGPGTPIRTGFARSSWRFGLGAPVDGPSVPKYEGWVAPPLDLGALDRMTILDKAFLTSDCVYMGPLEFGHSQQAPVGMIRTTLMQVQEIANEVTKAGATGSWQPTS